jgi:aminoglycoside phosphotransferase (APT) family kinase protein
MTDPLRHRPPERTLRWVADSIGAGSRIASLRPLTAGGWLATHAVTVVDRGGEAHRLVLRRWARPGWEIEDPDFSAAREAGVLELLAGSAVPAPRVIAADTEAAVCDVPALLLTRLPGHPPALPADMDSFLAQLAEALVPIHAVDDDARERIPAYRNYYDPRRLEPPPWTKRHDLWERAIELASADPPAGPRCLIHRDYHPENTLWARGRLTGIVDWTAASWGPAAVDTAHMRWNLAVTYGPDVAEEFLRHHRELTSDPLADQHYWDVVTVVDILPEVDPTDWPAFELARLERYLEGALSRR